MNYNVKELIEKLEERISGLGIEPKFKENPAYASALAEIGNLISQMNMFEEAKTVNVREEKGKISFNWVSSFGTKYSMDILCSNPESFRCVKTEEKKSIIGPNGQTIKEKKL